MNLIKSSIALSLLAACFCATAAEPTEPDNSQAKVVPVLVQVNSHGKVTGVDPGIHLTPKFSQLLRKNLAEMITKPAVDKHGKPISSQFVMTLSVQTTPRAGGEYDTRFKYVSASPVPAGPLHWASNGHQLGLVRDAPLGTQRNSIPPYDEQPMYSRRPSPAPAPAPPAAQNGSSS